MYPKDPGERIDRQWSTRAKPRPSGEAERGMSVAQRIAEIEHRARRAKEAQRDLIESLRKLTTEQLNHLMTNTTNPLIADSAWAVWAERTDS